MYAILDEAARRARAYLDSLDRRSVAPSAAATSALSRLDEPLPRQPGDPAETLGLLDRLVSPATLAMAGPRFFGFVIGGALPVTLAANWLAGAWDQNASMYRVTVATALIEDIALRWLVDVFGLPSKCAGAFVTGATMANLCSL